MWLNVAIKILAGAVIGGLIGLAISYARRCGGPYCNTKPSLRLRLFYVLAMAVFGAGAAWYLVHR